MKYTRNLGLGLSLLLLFSCKPPSESGTASDSTAYEADTLDYVGDEDANEPSSEPLVDVVDYYPSIDDSVKTALASFAPLEEVLRAAKRAIYFKDSVEFQRQSTELTDPKDTALFMPHMRVAYNAILDYKTKMANAKAVEDECPRLIDIDRTPGQSDKTSEILPETQNNRLLSHGEFFFMGGAPFMERSPETVAGVDGKPELRYTTSVTENAEYFFNSVYHNSGGAIDVTFGPELRSYESGMQEVNGIGSLIHTFQQRINVFFLTENGAVPATLISVKIKLVPENMGCISDAPLYTFACSENIQADEILGVFAPYLTMSLDKMQINRYQPGAWTIDLNGDGIADLACVAGVFEGIASDQMNEVLWFVNITGEWHILDWGADPDCT